MTDNNWQDEDLWIVTASTSSENKPADGRKVATGSNPYSNSTTKDEETKDSRINAGKLATQMSQFVGVVSHLFNHVQKQVEPQGKLQLDEITLTVEISSEGEVKLLGSGVKAAGKGAIELKFKRSSPTLENSP